MFPIPELDRKPNLESYEMEINRTSPKQLDAKHVYVPASSKSVLKISKVATPLLNIRELIELSID